MRDGLMGKLRKTQIKTEEVAHFLHKNNTFIQVFSSTSTYGALFFSLDTKHKYSGGRGRGERCSGMGGGQRGELLLHLLYELVLRRKGRKQLCQKESHTERQQYHPI